MDTAAGTDPVEPLGPDVTITVCPGGPLLVRGPAAVLDGDGAPISRRDGPIALCRCGRSGLAPYCDGTHKLRRG